MQEAVRFAVKAPPPPTIALQQRLGCDHGFLGWDTIVESAPDSWKLLRCLDTEDGPQVTLVG
jgi:hypothetical protein